MIKINIGIQEKSQNQEKKSDKKRLKLYNKKVRILK